jgi:hypothetical protein
MVHRIVATSPTLPGVNRSNRKYTTTCNTTPMTPKMAVEIRP